MVNLLLFYLKLNTTSFHNMKVNQRSKFFISLIALSLLYFYRVSWVSSALCLSAWSACCRLCTSACFCPRPRGSPCLPSQENFTSSTLKASTNSVTCILKHSINWVKCVFPRPCRQTFVLLKYTHSHPLPSSLWLDLRELLIELFKHERNDLDLSFIWSVFSIMIIISIVSTCMHISSAFKNTGNKFIY